MIDNSTHKTQKGFTLLELLIVISVIAILSIILTLTINPAETLRKSRDAERLSDLTTLKKALILYVTEKPSPDLDALINNCFGIGVTNAQINYSAQVTDTLCGATPAKGSDVMAGSTFLVGDFCRYANGNTTIDGTGWIPVDLSVLPGGSPITSLPIDPTNTVITPTAPTSTDLTYRYACQGNTIGKPSLVFELNAQLESEAYTVTDDKRVKDGGDNPLLYEVGSSLRLMGAGSNY